MEEGPFKSKREGPEKAHHTALPVHSFDGSMLTFIPVLFVSPSLSPIPTSVLSLLAQLLCPACTSRAHLPALSVHGLIPARSERCVQCLSSTPLMGRSTPSNHRVEETRTAMLEEPGIGACCGREFLWETGKSISEKLRQSHIGIENQDTHPFYPEQLSICVLYVLLEHLEYFISLKEKLLTRAELRFSGNILTLCQSCTFQEVNL